MFIVFAGWERWFEWIQWLPTWFHKHNRPTNQWFDQHWYRFPYWWSDIFQWVHLSVGSVHCSDPTHCIHCSIHGWKVSIILVLVSGTCFCNVLFLVFCPEAERNTLYPPMLNNTHDLWKYPTLLVCSGNHERDWPDSGSFYDTMDSGGECGVPAETIFYVPAENRAKYW